jgi:hypothetical protein
MSIGAHEALGLISGAFLAAGCIPLSADWTYVWERAKADDHVLATWLGYAHLRSVPPVELFGRVLSTPPHDEIGHELIRRVRRIRIATVLAGIGSTGIFVVVAIEILFVRMGSVF